MSSTCLDCHGICRGSTSESFFHSRKKGNLFSGLNEGVLAYIAQQILIALEALHKHKIAHRDIKPSNVILSIHGPVKLVDFGLSVDVSIGPDDHMVGSSYWMAPEVIRGLLHTTPVDIWGFGIIMAELLHKMPFSATTNSIKMMFDIAVKGSPILNQGEFSNECLSFIASCLKSDPSERPTAAKLLNHDFIRHIEHTSEQQMGDWVYEAFYVSNDDDVSDNDMPHNPTDEDDD